MSQFCGGHYYVQALRSSRGFRYRLLEVDRIIYGLVSVELETHHAVPYSENGYAWYPSLFVASKDEGALIRMPLGDPYSSM